MYADGWGLPISSPELDELVDRCDRSDGAVIVGAVGSGRRMLAEAVAAAARPAAVVIHAQAQPGDNAFAFETLRSAGFRTLTDGASPAHLAQRLREEYPGSSLVLIVEDIDFADPMSVRVLSALTRQRTTTVIGTARDRGSRNVQALELPVFNLPPLDGAKLRDLVSQRLRTRLLDRDTHWLESVCGGNYEALRWLVDTCEQNDGVIRCGSVARMSIPRGEVPPAWELEPRMTTTLLGRIVSILVEAPLSLLRTVVGAEQLASAEENEILIVDAGRNCARFCNRSIGLDILFRMGQERRRLTIMTILDNIADVHQLTPRAAASLVMEASEAGLEVPTVLGQYAIPKLVSMGYPDYALAFQPDTPERAAELMLADIWIGDVAAATSRFHDWFVTVDDIETTHLEAAALALVLGELHEGPDGRAAGALDIAIDSLTSRFPRSAQMLGAYRALIRPSAAAPDWDSFADTSVGSITTDRATRALAFYHLMDGRPEQAHVHAKRARNQPGSIDAYLGGLLEFLIQLARPDLQAARRALPPRAPHPSSPTGENVLWAALGVYDGSPASAFAALAIETPTIEVSLPAALPAVHGVLALCATFLGDRTTARTHLPFAQVPSPSPVFETIRLFILGSAIAALRRGSGANDAFSVFALGSRVAAQSRMRALTLPCALGQRLVYERARFRFSGVQIPDVPDVSSRPFDGIFHSYDRLVRAHIDKDYPAIAAIAMDLNNKGLLLDATGVATTIPAADIEAGIPRSIQRAVSRLARRRPLENDADRQGSGLLTQREAEVAGLVRSGLTDREIAIKLRLSVRTVGVHVSRILKKLGIRTRHQIGAVLDGFDRT